jgi:hypothetical protein
MEELKSNAGQGLGIAGLILGILAIPLGIIPCTFFLGVLFGLAGIVLSIVALVQASKLNGPKAIIIIALVCSIIGFSFAATWGVFLSRGTFIKEIIDDIRNDRNLEFHWDGHIPAPPDMPDMDSINSIIDSNMDELRQLTDTLRMLEHEN